MVMYFWPRVSAEDHVVERLHETLERMEMRDKRVERGLQVCHYHRGADALAFDVCDDGEHRVAVRGR